MKEFRKLLIGFGHTVPSYALTWKEVVVNNQVKISSFKSSSRRIVDIFSILI